MKKNHTPKKSTRSTILGVFCALVVGIGATFAVAPPAEAAQVARAEERPAAPTLTADDAPPAEKVICWVSPDSAGCYSYSGDCLDLWMIENEVYVDHNSNTAYGCFGKAPSNLAFVTQASDPIADVSGTGNALQSEGPVVMNLIFCMAVGESSGSCMDVGGTCGDLNMKAGVEYGSGNHSYLCLETP